MSPTIKTKERSEKKTLSCKPCGPGPQYDLRPVVGFQNHCISKYRNPAYTIGHFKKIKPNCVGPGPAKYSIEVPFDRGYTIPKAVLKSKVSCTPGPKYMLPRFTAPAYSITPRKKAPCIPPTSGPYSEPKRPIGPAYTFGHRPKPRACQYNPPLRDLGPVSLIKPRNPTFCIIPRPKDRKICVGPGPSQYSPKLDKEAPKYTFGYKHSPCEMIPRTECDEDC